MTEMKESFAFENMYACFDHFIHLFIILHFKTNVQYYRKRYSPTLNICKQCFLRHGSCKRLFPTKHCLYFVHHPGSLQKSNKQSTQSRTAQIAW